MKNLLIYVSPTKNFVNATFNKVWKDETSILVKIQIDNSLEVGWKREDILLVTNFDYEYNGVKSLVVGDDNFCPFSPTASKINVIIDLFEQGIIKKELYWFHDFDAFQLEEILEGELVLDGVDIGLTDYGSSIVNPGRSLRWSTGTIFFKESALDIFKLWKNEVYRFRINEEIALLEMLKKGRNIAIKNRVKKINITYNLATRMRNISESYEMAIKPLKVIHFHPFDRRIVEGETGGDNIAVCVYGKNKMNKVLVNERLISIFKEHGII